MPDARSIFEVIIEAIDHLSAPFERMSAEVHRFDAPIREVGERLEHLGEVAGIERISERFGELRESIGRTAEKLSEFVGPFALLAGVGSAAGLVELANKVSESGEHIHDAAIKIGIDAESLQKLEFAGRLNSVPAEDLEMALTKLNRVIGDSAAGKNKNAASMFQHLGIAIRDANHHVLDAAQILPKLADAIQRNENPAIRTRIAVTAFSRAGATLIPLLEKGGAALNKYGEEAQKAGILTNKQVDQAKEFADKSAILRASIEGVANAIGAKLFPVLQPIIEHVTKWAQANRDLIATKVEEVARKLADALESVDWEGFFAGVEKTTEAIGHWVNKNLGLKGTIIALVAFMGAPFLGAIANVVIAMTGLATSTIPLLLGAFTGLVGFAATASLKIGLIFDALAGASAIPGIAGAFDLLSGAFVGLGAAIEATPVGWILGAIALIGFGAYELYEHWSKVKEFFAHLWDNSAFFRIAVILNPIGEMIVAGAFLVSHWHAVQAAFETIWDGIAGFFERGYDRIKPIIEALKTFGSLNAAVADYVFGGAAERIGKIGGVPNVAGGAQGLWDRAQPTVDMLTGRNLFDDGKPAPAPIIGGNGAQPDKTDGSVHVKIDIGNLSPGSRATTTSSGPVQPEVNVGWNMRDMAPAGF